ncbi:MAG: hypothetical protein ACRDL3_01310 [Solirubrobacterales bacterium]
MTELFERTMRSGRPEPPPGLVGYFERTLLDHPWADPEIPSLVYEAGDGRILGFIGSHVRRLVFDGRQIRMGCAGQLVSDPEQRRLAIGARLLRSYMAGPQELTITDGATDVVNEMWTHLGGYAIHPGSLAWTRLFRPGRAVGDRWLERRGSERWRRVARAAWPLLDAPATPVTRPPGPATDVETEELTPRALIEHRPQALGDARLWVDYDEPFLEWLFGEMTAVRTRGELKRRLVRRGDRVLGWYVVYIRPRGLSQVMQIAAAKGELETLIDRLFADAWRGGAAAVEGRLEPALYEPIYGRRCVLRYSTPALFHSDDPELAAAISLGRSALTRLDGEWWMGHHTEPFR